MQGISPAAAVSMAAAEMTARTAVDASGAPWAAGAFARVLGYPVPRTAVPVAQAQAPPIPVPAPAAPAPVVPPDAWARPAPNIPAPDRATVWPAAPVLTPTAPPSTVNSRGLAMTAAVAAAIAAPMQLLWSWTLHIHGTPFWLAAISLMLGLGIAAGWVASGWRGGAGFAAVLGVAVPAASWAVFATAAAATSSGLSGVRHHVIELVAVVWLLGSGVAALAALAGLRRSRQLARCKPGFLAGMLALAGAGFALANILAQEKINGQGFGNILGHGVHGWWIVWGVVFLVLVSVPPLLAAFRLAGSRVQLAVWAGWLLFGLAWQVSDTPTGGLTAAPGLYLTWILWIVALAGTAVMAPAEAQAVRGARRHHAEAASRNTTEPGAQVRSESLTLAAQGYDRCRW